MSHYGFGFGIGKAKKAGAVSYDADAQAFFTAASITNTTQKNAVNQLVLDLKSYGVWTKSLALYPVVGGSASSHAVNLKTPGTFNLSFSTGWTHSSTGMLPNGAAYANTFFIPTSNFASTNGHLSYYATTNSSAPANGVTMGSVYLSGDYRFTLLSTASNQLYPLIASGTSGGTGLNYTATRFNRLLIANRNNASTQDGWDNNTKTALSRAAYFHSAYSIYIGARNNTGSADTYGTQECKFASIGNELTDTEASNFYTAVQTYQTTLSRNV
jgi:hypothetical protein